MFTKFLFIVYHYLTTSHPMYFRGQFSQLFNLQPRFGLSVYFQQSGGIPSQVPQLTYKYQK